MDVNRKPLLLMLAHFAVVLSIFLATYVHASHWLIGGVLWRWLLIQALPTLILAALAAFYPSTESPRYRWAVVAALGFSLVGGYFLALPKQQFFWGVVGFFFANVCYVTAFSTGVRIAKRAVPFVVMGLAGGSILVMAWPLIPMHLKLPVLLYGISLISNSAQAITRAMVLRQVGTVLAAVGAVSLLISDSCIAVHEFHSPFSHAGLAIALTYFAGQWLIVTSILQPGETRSRDAVR